MKNESVFLSNIHHAYAQTDGTYKFPNSFEGDLISQAKYEIEMLQQELEIVKGFHKVAVSERNLLQKLSV